MLQRYEELFPRALAPRRLQLNYAVGDEFKTLVDRYLRRGTIYFVQKKKKEKKIKFLNLI